MWLVFDLGRQANDFIKARVGGGTVAMLLRQPASRHRRHHLPIALLLALLYCLGRMTQSNEILSMLSAGVSLGRILLPFFPWASLLTGLST